MMQVSSLIIKSIRVEMHTANDYTQFIGSNMLLWQLVYYCMHAICHTIRISNIIFATKLT